MAASSATDEVELIRELLRSAGLTAEPIETAPSEADERVLAAVLAADAPATVIPLAPRRGWWRPAVRVAVAAAAVLGIAVAGVSWLSGGTPAAAGGVPMLPFPEGDILTVQDGGGTPAQGVLERLADIAAAQPVVSGEGYQRVTSYAWYTATTDDESVIAPMRQTWTTGPDGSATNEVVQSPALDLHGRLIDGRFPPGGEGSTDTFEPGTFDPGLAQDLPRDPAELRAALVSGEMGRCPPGDDDVLMCFARRLVDLHGTRVVPADLDAATWRMLAAEPGLKDLGPTVDRLGRPGLAVGFEAVIGELRAVQVLVVSPDDGRLLEWENIVTDYPEGGIDAPTVTDFQVFAETRWESAP